MIQITVTSDIQTTIGRLDAALARHVPFATSLAINRTAKDVQAAFGQEARSAFDRPRPFTVGAGATYLKTSSKHHLVAEVGYKDIQARYLRWQIAGGQRVQKAFERALSGLGLLPAGYVTTPGAGLRLDAYGNIPRAQIVQILGQLKSRASVFGGRGKRVTRQGLFVVMPGAADPRVRHLSPGIWRRIETPGGTDRAVLPLVHYADAATYTHRLDLAGVARREVAAKFQAHFSAAWQQATAR
jgi:hypothetical protein